MKARELLSILYKDGWRDKDQKGSHLHLIHPTKKGKISVPIHSGDINSSLLKLILKQADIR